MHRYAGKRTADADAAHAHGGEIAHGEAECAAVEEIDRLWRCGFDDSFDLFARLDAGRIETIRTGVLKSTQPARDIVEIGHAADEAFGACREHDLAAGAVDRGTRGLHQ